MNKPENLMKALLKKLYTELTDADDNFDPRNEEERFITWCLPGIPFDPEDLHFAQGLVGHGATPQEQGADTARLAQQAAQFARLVDFIPDVSGIFDGQQQLVAFHRNEKALSRVYEQVLRMSQVADLGLTDQEKQIIDNIRKQLYRETEIETTDPETFAPVKQTIVEDGPMLQQYKIKRVLYEKALQDFKDAQVAARAGVSPEAVLRFEEQGATLAERVDMAMDEWETGGHKNMVEAMFAKVDDLTSRSLLLWKEDVQNRFDRCKKLDVASGVEYLYTTFVPARFTMVDAGWSEFSFEEKEMQAFESHQLTKFGAAGGFGGLFGMKAKVSGTNESHDIVSDISNFKMSFELAQIPLSRPWFDPAFLESRAWRLHQDAQLSLEGEFLSDGQIPPSGILPAYPTSIIFIRNVTVNFNELHDESHEIHRTLKAGGGFGWGPVRFGGNYERDSTTKLQKTLLTDEGLRVAGLQILGFRNHLLGMCPHPLETIPEDAFV